MADYPWYGVVNGEEIEQGDILESCRVFSPPDDLPDDAGAIVEFDELQRDVIVLSQTCDLVKGREKVDQILLCAIWTCAEVGGYLATAKGMEDARRGNLPAYHMLAQCDLSGFERDVTVVDFRRVYCLPVTHFRKRLWDAGDRIRLLPPYREHLAQSFARYFMRVGLPIDIPSFR